MHFLRLIVLATYCALTFASSAGAQDVSALEMSPRINSEGFAGHIAGLQDLGAQLDIAQARVALAQGRFERVDKSAVDYGFVPDPIWLYFPLRNATTSEEWRLRLKENFFQEISAWLVIEGAPPVLLEFQDETSVFSTRRVAWSEVVVAFDLEPGQEGDIFIRYRSGGSTEIEFTLFDRETFELWTDRMTARNFIYYGMSLFLILAALAIWITTRHGIFVAYTAYATFGLLFVMHGDGNAFRFLWPDAPGFNGFASIPLGAGLVVFGANFARQFLQTALYHKVFDKLLLGTILITLAVAAASAVADMQVIKKILVLLAFLSMLLFTASAINAARTRFSEVRFFLLAWSGAVIASGIMTGRHWLGLEISEDVQYDSMRIVLVLDAALLGLAILDRLNSLRKSRSQALERSLEEAERNLSLSQRLQALEQRYAWAADLAQSREQQVADAIHDLRQPLNALRLNVRKMVSGDRDKTAREMEETFAFLEQLVDQELDAHPVETAAAPHQEERGDVSLAEVMQAIEAMFAEDATRKGLETHVGDCDVVLRLPAISVMRILANLYGNAIRYTQSGRVSMQVLRDAGGGVRIEVSDTGPGMTQAQFEQALLRSARLAQTADQPGSGLGLGIVRQMCEAHNLGLDLIDQVDGTKGTRIAVTIGAEHLG